MPDHQGKTQRLPELNSAHDPVALAYKFEALRTQSNKKIQKNFSLQQPAEATTEAELV